MNRHVFKTDAEFNHVEITACKHLGDLSGVDRDGGFGWIQEHYLLPSGRVLVLYAESGIEKVEAFLR